MSRLTEPSFYPTTQETEACCAELETHEQGCPAADRDGQAAGSAGVEQERAAVTENSDWSLQKSPNNQAHSSQPSVCGEDKPPALS